MKNFFKARIVPLFGIIALVAVIGFSMAGCKNDDDGSDSNKNGTPNPFIGTWTGNYNYTGNDGVSMTITNIITFTETAFIFRDNTNNNDPYSGTYTRSGNTAILTLGGESYTVTVSGNIFIFDGLTYTKR